MTDYQGTHDYSSTKDMTPTAIKAGTVLYHLGKQLQQEGTAETNTGLLRIVRQQFQLKSREEADAILFRDALVKNEQTESTSEGHQ